MDDMSPPKIGTNENATDGVPVAWSFAPYFQDSELEGAVALFGAGVDLVWNERNGEESRLVRA